MIVNEVEPLLNQNYRSFIGVSLKFRVKSPILIGKGVEPGENIREVLTIEYQGQTRFIIPSSSIKGVFRKISYSILMRMVEKLPTIYKYSALSHMEGELEISHHIRFGDDFEKEIDEFYKSNRDFIDKICVSIYGTGCERVMSEKKEDFYELILSINCPLCILYGSKFFKGLVTFKPYILNYEEKYLDTRPHVSIDRSTKTSLENYLYTDMVLNMINQDINIDIILLDLEPGSIYSKIFANTLRFVKEAGLMIGGGRSIGYGLLELKPEESKWYIREYSSISKYLTISVRRGIDSLINYLINPST